MTIDVMCSCCGNHQKLSNKRIQDTADLIHSGWGSCGSALYCPECSKSWKERNGKRPMGDERNTFFVIMNLFFEAKKAEDGE